MTIRKVVVPIDGTPASRATLETAFAVGTLMQAHVEVLHVRIEPAAAVPFVGEGMTGALLQDLIELTERQIAQRADAARALFADARASLGIAESTTPQAAGASARFVEISGREDEVAVERARLADLAVVGRPDGATERIGAAVFDALLLESGGPVLVAPPAAPAGLARHVAIAWDDGREAARALRAALPFLARADHVSLVVAAEDEGTADRFAGVVEYLSWHGIAAERRLVVGHRAASEALVDACADADLVVMGAYAHSRLWRLILGDVTQHMIAETTRPLLMAH